MSAWGSSRGVATPQLGRRVAILGGIALALFGIVFFRLWFLQVLDGAQYLKEAQDNRVRNVSVAPPRGQILDRNGRVLVDNSSGTVVQLMPSKLPAEERDDALGWGQRVTAELKKPKAERKNVPIPGVKDPDLVKQFDELAPLLKMTPAELQETVVRQIAMTPYAPIRLKVGVSEQLRNYLLERSDRFPAVGVQTVYLRKYPQGELAAQMLGTLGAVTANQLKEKANRSLPRDAVIGQEGLEYAYDQYLRGVAGTTRVVVDSAGRPKSTSETQTPIAGRSVKLTLDAGLQRRGQQALANYGGGKPGAFVAMDPRTGEILALGSAPTFDPKILTKPISNKKYEQLFGEDAGAPRFNRAISGAYPTGSIFKPITALAGLKAGTLNPNDFVEDGGKVEIGNQVFTNAGKAANGSVNLVDAMRVSSDVYFYLQGAALNRLKGQVLQKEAHTLGLGQRTGVDLPGEFGGTVPDRAWRDDLNKREAACEKKEKKANCGIADGTNRAWSVGDNVQLSVGQGDLQATPLQMAVVYSALANGGEVVRPHVGLEIENSDGHVDQRLPGGNPKKIAMPEGYAQILEGLHESTAMGGGTSVDVFSDWPQNRYKLYGKTGTAERPPKEDQSWFAAFVQDPKRPIVVIATVEEGGFGATSAAPVACQMLARWYSVKAACSPGGDRSN
jgi:penicillin-binding protein 2